MSVAPVALPQQLTFDVGGELAKPTGSSLSVTGKADIRSQLYIDDDVLVQIVDAGGELIASFDATCIDVAFKKHDATETTTAWVERTHKLKLGDRND
jgi:hypothetical protein